MNDLKPTIDIEITDFDDPDNQKELILRVIKWSNEEFVFCIFDKETSTAIIPSIKLNNEQVHNLIQFKLLNNINNESDPFA